MTTPVEITVRGTASRRLPAELALIDLTAEIRGPERLQVAQEAGRAHADLTAALAALEDGQLHTWADSGVQIRAERPWRPDGERAELEQVASLSVHAEFTDVEALSHFLDTWGTDERFQIGQLEWALTTERRQAAEAEIQVAAVHDAVRKAQAYADAVGAGSVRTVELADPGLLRPEPEAPRYALRAMSASADSAGGRLRLRPDEIELRCEVDARFVAGSGTDA